VCVCVCVCVCICITSLLLYLAAGAAGGAPPVFMYCSYASIDAAACARCCCLSSGLDSVGPAHTSRGSAFAFACLFRFLARLSRPCEHRSFQRFHSLRALISQTCARQGVRATFNICREMLKQRRVILVLVSNMHRCAHAFSCMRPSATNT
jgi:hypothetical protein